MSRYSPTVLPEYYGPQNVGGDIASALEGYIQNKRQAAADQRAQQEFDYTMNRHRTVDPLEDAFLRGKLYDMGIVPSDGGGTGGPSFRLPSGRPPIDPGMSPPSRQPGFRLPEPPSVDPGFGPPRGLPPQRDVDPGFDAGVPRVPTPGSFDLGSGTFHSPAVDLGGGYSLDPRLTPEGRARAARDEQERRVIAAYVGAGVDPMRTNAEVLGGDRSGLHEELFPPRSLADELALIAARGRANARVASIRASRPASASTSHPELRAVESQIDDTRAALAAAQRQRDRIGDFPLTQADSSNADELDSQIGDLGQRMDSLNVVRDSIAARVEGQATEPRPRADFSGVRSGSSTTAPAGATAKPDTAAVGRARARAQALQRQGKSRDEILRTMRAEGFNVQ